MLTKEKRPIHIPTSYRLTVRRFVLVKAFFKSQSLLFVSASPFFFILLADFSFEQFFNVFSCSNQNNDGNILQNSESLVAMTHDAMATVVKISCSLSFLKLLRTLFVSLSPFFLFVNSSCLAFFEAFTCLIRNNLTSIFKTARHFEQTN